MALRYQAGKLTSLYNLTVAGGVWGHLSAVADVDLDGKHVGIDAASDCAALWVLLAKICNRGAVFPLDVWLSPASRGRRAPRRAFGV